MRRFILPILVYLVIGAVVNVGVAWWLAARPYAMSKSESGSWVYIQRNLRDLPTSFVVEQLAYFDGGRFEGRESLEEFKTDAAEFVRSDDWLARLPNASILRDRSPLIECLRKEPGRRKSQFTERIAGWPFWSMRGEFVSDPQRAIPAVSSRGRLAVPSEWSVVDGADWVPCQPLWIGTLGNAAFYGSLLSVVAFVEARLIARLKTVLRSRRGLCINCGYDRRGLAAASRCPECGAPHAKGAS